VQNVEEVGVYGICQIAPVSFEGSYTVIAYSMLLEQHTSQTKLLGIQYSMVHQTTEI